MLLNVGGDTMLCSVPTGVSDICSAPLQHSQCICLLQTLVDIRLAAETVGNELKDIQRLLQVLEKLFALVTPAKQKCVPLRHWRSCMPECILSSACQAHAFDTCIMRSNGVRGTSCCGICTPGGACAHTGSRPLRGERSRWALSRPFYVYISSSWWLHECISLCKLASASAEVLD